MLYAMLHTYSHIEIYFRKEISIMEILWTHLQTNIFIPRSSAVASAFGAASSTGTGATGATAVGAVTEGATTAGLGLSWKKCGTTWNNCVAAGSVHVYMSVFFQSVY